MGNCIRSIVSKLSSKQGSGKVIVLLIVGLDNAGKTLILNHLSHVTDKSVLPTMGFRVVSLKFKSYSVKIYDIGGSPQIRSLWSKYYADVHGLIYVVDASNISRIAENKVIFEEVVSHEHIMGKPLLLLANKQDLNGAIDELDVVESLNVESVANNMRCPTRVETCSCTCDKSQSRNSTMGIHNGYIWLLDIVIKNYTALNNRVKDCQNIVNEKNRERHDTAMSTPSKLSIHSDPFKPIKELLRKEEPNSVVHNTNGIDGSIKLKNMFKSRNKTAPLTPGLPSSNIRNERSSHATVGTLTPALSGSEGKEERIAVIINPTSLKWPENEKSSKLTRPYTAPSRTRSVDILMITNIPGQISH